MKLFRDYVNAKRRLCLCFSRNSFRVSSSRKKFRAGSTRGQHSRRPWNQSVMEVASNMSSTRASSKGPSRNIRFQGDQEYYGKQTVYLSSYASKTLVLESFKLPWVSNISIMKTLKIRVKFEA